MINIVSFRAKCNLLSQKIAYYIDKSFCPYKLGVLDRYFHQTSFAFVITKINQSIKLTFASFPFGSNILSSDGITNMRPL